MNRRQFTILILLVASAATQVPAQSRSTSRDRAEAAIEIITRTIIETERDTDKFVRSFRRALNVSAIDGTNREDDVNRSARDLENSMDRVRKNWEKGKDVSRTKRYVSEALSAARDVNLTMRNRRLPRNVETDWEDVRRQMNLLARAFRLPSIRW
jgi:hypothetical protein